MLLKRLLDCNVVKLIYSINSYVVKQFTFNLFNKWNFLEAVNFVAPWTIKNLSSQKILCSWDLLSTGYFMDHTPQTVYISLKLLLL